MPAQQQAQLLGACRHASLAGVAARAGCPKAALILGSLIGRPREFAATHPPPGHIGLQGCCDRTHRKQGRCRICVQSRACAGTYGDTQLSRHQAEPRRQRVTPLVSCYQHEQALPHLAEPLTCAKPQARNRPGCTLRGWIRCAVWRRGPAGLSSWQKQRPASIHTGLRTGTQHAHMACWPAASLAGVQPVSKALDTIRPQGDMSQWDAVQRKHRYPAHGRPAVQGAREQAGRLRSRCPAAAPRRGLAQAPALPLLLVAAWQPAYHQPSGSGYKSYHSRRSRCTNRD